MALPAPPTNYEASVDITAVTLTWQNGEHATSVRHELSTDGENWSRIDDDIVPATTSAHSLQETNTLYHLRAKSLNSEGESVYTPVVQVTTGSYDP